MEIKVVGGSLLFNYGLVVIPEYQGMDMDRGGCLIIATLMYWPKKDIYKYSLEILGSPKTLLFLFSLAFPFSLISSFMPFSSLIFFGYFFLFIPLTFSIISLVALYFLLSVFILNCIISTSFLGLSLVFNKLHSFYFSFPTALLAIRFACFFSICIVLFFFFNF